MKATVFNNSGDSKVHWNAGTVLRGVDVADAEQLYSLIGLLIIEGRIPISSPKGRVVGPHAYRGGDGSAIHTCDRSDQCSLAALHRDQLVRFGRHGIPLSLEVLLLPDCPHHVAPPTSSSPGPGAEQGLLQTPNRDRVCLLEQWTFQLRQRKNVSDHTEPLTALLHTVSSYLHFSQLSAWLVESGGHKPRNICYRIAVTRESSLPVTSEAFYQTYAFPRICSGESNILEISMLSLRRQLVIPAIVCASCEPAGDEDEGVLSVISGDVASTSTASSSGPRRPQNISADFLKTQVQMRDRTGGESTTSRHGSRGRKKALSESLKKEDFYLHFDAVIDNQVDNTSPACSPNTRNDPWVHDGGGPSTPQRRLPNSTSRTFHQPEKDLTPYPKRDKESLEDVIAEFSQLNVGEKSASPKLGATAAARQLFPPSSSGISERRDSRKKKRERRILFSDSSSSESLDRIPPRLPTGLGSAASSMESLLDSEELPYPSPPATNGSAGKLVTTGPVSPLATETSTGSPSAPRANQLDRCESCAANQAASTSVTSKSPKCSEPSYLLRERIARGRRSHGSGIFHRKTGLPLQSSPAPLKRNLSGKFDYDEAVGKLKYAKSAQCVSQKVRCEEEGDLNDTGSKFISASAPATSANSRLVVNFEESMLNGRIQPVGVVDDFSLDIGASGAFCPPHIRLPLTAYFFQLSDDNAPSPYLGYVDLTQLPNKRGYHVPKKGSLQLTLFNPNGAVLKMFVVLYDLSDMPSNCQTFLRQRTIYMPVSGGTVEAVLNGGSSTPPSPASQQQPGTTNGWAMGSRVFQVSEKKENGSSVEGSDLPAYLRYLVHLRFHTTKSNKLYLHTDIRLIFSRDKFEFDPRVATYELRSFVEAPINPRYSPKK